MSTTPKRTALFRQFHTDDLLLLPNAWDAGSARLIASLGARAIATTSAGVAWAHGYADGDRLPVAHLLETIRDIRRVTDLPLTVDIEGGYSEEPAQVAATVLQLVEAGVSGINVEDGDREPRMLCDKIAAVRTACTAAGADVFINVRTDVYLRQLAQAGEPRVRMSLERARLYRDAGADGLFVPGVTEEDEIRALAAQARLPLNVLWRAALPDVRTLASWGVRRLSAGTMLAESVAGHLRTRARAFLEDPRLAADPGAMSYGELNGLFPPA